MSAERSVLSKEFINAEITVTVLPGEDPVVLDAQPVRLAVVLENDRIDPEEDDWHEAEWAGDPGSTRVARVLAGPGTDVPLVKGGYWLFADLVDNPEIPVIRVGYIRVT